MLTDKFIPLQTSKRTGCATAEKRILSISARTKGRQNSSADGGPEGSLQFEEGIEKTVKWYWKIKSGWTISHQEITKTTIIRCTTKDKHQGLMELSTIIFH